jgi:hypothetical protein
MRLQLSTEGQSKATAWKPWSDFLGSGWDIPVASAQFGSVTGISQAEGAAVAQVEYTYQWVPTEFGQKLGITPYGNTKPLTAALQRFDDEWRVQSLDPFGIEEPKQFSLTTPELWRRSPPQARRVVRHLRAKSRTN